MTLSPFAPGHKNTAATHNGNITESASPELLGNESTRWL